jgi:hypothetical protein
MTFPMAFAKYLLVCMQCWSSVSRFQERTEKTETTHRTDDSRGRKQISFVLKKRGGGLPLTYYWEVWMLDVASEDDILNQD